MAKIEAVTRLVVDDQIIEPGDTAEIRDDLVADLVAIGAARELAKPKLAKAVDPKV